jgi:hypothetical protein
MGDVWLSKNLCQEASPAFDLGYIRAVAAGESSRVQRRSRPRGFGVATKSMSLERNQLLPARAAGPGDRDGDQTRPWAVRQIMLWGEPTPLSKPESYLTKRK